MAFNSGRMFGSNLGRMLRSALGTGAFLALMFHAPTPAVAGVGGAAAPSYPASVNVGQIFAAALVITNGSDGTNASENMNVLGIFHTPSCGAGIGSCTAQDPLVFQLGVPV